MLRNLEFDAAQFFGEANSGFDPYANLMPKGI